MILLAEKYTSVAEMHSELGLTTFLERRLFHVSGFMYKVCGGQILASKLLLLFEEVENIRSRDTRSSQRGDLVVMHCRTQYGERAIQIYGSRIWNLLPVDLRKCNTFETFCRNYWKLK